MALCTHFVVEAYLLNKPGTKPSFSPTCELCGLGNQKLGFFRSEILSRYVEAAKSWKIRQFPPNPLNPRSIWRHA